MVDRPTAVTALPASQLHIIRCDRSRDARTGCTLPRVWQNACLDDRMPEAAHMRGPHDIGGLPAGPVDPHAHDPTFWEKQIDGMRAVVGAKGIYRTDENRRWVESLGEDAYERLTYYERWTAALMRALIDKGVLTQDEIDARVALVRRRLAETGELEMGSGEAEKCG
jgi:hypothetical protein